MSPMLTSPSASLPLAYQTACSPGARCGAFQLNYCTRLRTCNSNSNPYGLWVSPYQLQEKSQIFVAMVGGRVISDLTLVSDGESGLPYEESFTREIATLRDRGRKLAELAFFAHQRKTPSCYLVDFCKLLRLVAQFSMNRGIQELMIISPQRQAGFYTRHLGFRVIGSSSKVSALSLDLQRLADIRPECWEDLFGEPVSRESLQPYEIPAAEREQLLEISRAVSSCDATSKCRIP